jgi:hypothetical protein
LQAVNSGNKISARIFHAYFANISCGNGHLVLAIHGHLVGSHRLAH